MKLDTQEEVNRLSKKMVEVAKNKGLNVKEDDYAIIQPYNNGQTMTILVETDEFDGERTIKVNVIDSTFVLDAIDGELDVFK